MLTVPSIFALSGVLMQTTTDDVLETMRHLSKYEIVSLKKQITDLGIKPYRLSNQNAVFFTGTYVTKLKISQRNLQTMSAYVREFFLKLTAMFVLDKKLHWEYIYFETT